MTCDICGKNCASLVDLQDAYKTTDIKKICTDCEKIVNRKNGKLLSMVLNIKTDLLKRFMCERKAATNQGDQQ